VSLLFNGDPIGQVPIPAVEDAPQFCTFPGRGHPRRMGTRGGNGWKSRIPQKQRAFLDFLARGRLTGNSLVEGRNGCGLVVLDVKERVDFRNLE
jgi:hypothetical protein